MMARLMAANCLFKKLRVEATVVAAVLAITFTVSSVAVFGNWAHDYYSGAVAISLFPARWTLLGTPFASIRAAALVGWVAFFLALLVAAVHARAARAGEITLLRFKPVPWLVGVGALASLTALVVFATVGELRLCFSPANGARPVDATACQGAGIISARNYGRWVKAEWDGGGRQCCLTFADFPKVWLEGPLSVLLNGTILGFVSWAVCAANVAPLEEEMRDLEFSSSVVARERG